MPVVSAFVPVLMSQQLVWSSSMTRRVLGMGMKPWCVYHSYGAQALIPAADRRRIALTLLGFIARRRLAWKPQ